MFCINNPSFSYHFEPFFFQLANHRQMVVTWTTPNRTSCSVVWYGLVSEDHLKKANSALDKMATGNCSALVDAGPQRRTVYIHRVLLRGLMPGSLYRKWASI